jgi:rod shape-determining protein MreC
VSLILVGRAGGPLASGEGALRSMLRAPFVTVESAGEAAFRPLAGAAGGLARADDLARAKAELQRERERAGSEAARADSMTAEAGRLAGLLHLEGPSGGDGVAARVMSTGEGRSATLMLDRGTADGIAPGMPVVAAGGLVGRVLDAAPRSSTVVPVTDPSSAVGVRCVSATAALSGAADCAGVGQGVGAATLRLDLLDPTASVEPGDLAVTSGLRHSRFPAGVPVGRIAGTRGHFVIRPFAPPDRLEVVKVLRWDPVP